MLSENRRILIKLRHWLHFWLFTSIHPSIPGLSHSSDDCMTVRVPLLHQPGKLLPEVHHLLLSDQQVPHHTGSLNVVPFLKKPIDQATEIGPNQRPILFQCLLHEEFNQRATVDTQERFRSGNINYVLEAFLQEHDALDLEHIVLPVQHEELVQVGQMRLPLADKHEVLGVAMERKQNCLNGPSCLAGDPHPLDIGLHSLRHPPKREGLIRHYLIAIRDVLARWRQSGQQCYGEAHILDGGLSERPHKHTHHDTLQTIRQVLLHLLLHLLLGAELLQTDIPPRQLHQGAIQQEGESLALDGYTVIDGLLWLRLGQFGWSAAEHAEVGGELVPQSRALLLLH